MSPKKIRYEVNANDVLGHRYRITIHVPIDIHQGQAFELHMPTWIPGSYMIRDFSKHIEGLRVQKGKISSMDSHSWSVNVGKSDALISYEVYAYDHSVRAAYLDATRAFFNPTSLLMEVKGARIKKNSKTFGLDIHLQKPRDSSWSVKTTLRAKKVDAQGFGHYVCDSYEECIDHPVVMGQFQEVVWSSHGTPHRMVIQGALNPVDKKQLANDLQRICEEQIKFFEPQRKKAPFQEYLFIVHATENGYGGLEHANSTALLCKRGDLPYEGLKHDKNRDYEDFLGLCSHEYFHAWMVKRVKPKAFESYDLKTGNRTELLWFFEGFTSYYDDLFLVRSACIDLQSYLKRIEKVWNLVLRNPGRLKQSVAQSSLDAWTKYYQMDENTPNAVVSYYAKGSLIGLGLDLLIRKETNQRASLDDVMRHLWQMSELTGRGIEEMDIDAALEYVVGAAFKKIWQSFKADYIHGTRDLPLDQWLPKQVKVKAKYKLASEDAEAAKMIWGIRTVAERGWVRLTHVLEGGYAQLVGLWAHDVIASVGGERLTPERCNEVLVFATAQLEQGREVKVVAYRHDREMILTVRQQAAVKMPPQYLLSWQ